MLQTINNGMSVETILSIGGVRKQVSIICLNIKPAIFLVFYTTLKAEWLNYEEELLLRHFTWKMDKHGRFCNVSKDLGQIICSLLFSILGSTFHEVANQFKDDRYRELIDFIEAVIPWRKQIIQESVDGCLEWLDVELSALPIFDAKY